MTSCHDDAPPGEHAAPAGQLPPHTSHPRHRSRRSHHNPISLRSRSLQRRSPQRQPDTHASHGSTSWYSSGWDTDKSQKSSSRRWNQSWGHAPQGHSMGQAQLQHQQHRQLEQSGQATVLATAAVMAAAALLIPDRPQQYKHGPCPGTCRSAPHTPSQPGSFPQPPPPALDDTEDQDPPSPSHPGSQWLDLWRSVMDTAKTDPLRIPTPRELGELDPFPALGTNQGPFEEPTPCLATFACRRTAHHGRDRPHSI